MLIGVNINVWISRLFATGILFHSGMASLVGQQISFNNFGENGSATAPIYAPEPSAPQLQKWGNSADANPAGTQVYTGEPLGTNYSVEAWYSLDPVVDVYALSENASVVRGSLTSFLALGFFSGGEPFVPNAPMSGVYLQVRAWDSGDGLYSSWGEAWNAAQSGAGNAVGWSKVFSQPVAFGTIPPDGLYNFESFNIFIVPEPSAVALIGLGGLALLVCHRLR